MSYRRSVLLFVEGTFSPYAKENRKHHILWSIKKIITTIGERASGCPQVSRFRTSQTSALQDNANLRRILDRGLPPNRPQGVEGT